MEHYPCPGSLAGRAVVPGSMPCKGSATYITSLDSGLGEAPWCHVLSRPLNPGLNFLLIWMEEWQGHGAGKVCRKSESTGLQQRHWSDQVLPLFTSSLRSHRSGVPVQTQKAKGWSLSCAGETDGGKPAKPLHRQHILGAMYCKASLTLLLSENEGLTGPAGSCPGH